MRREVTGVRGPVVAGGSDLAKVVLTLGPSRGPAGGLNGGEAEANQKAEQPEHNQKLNERKPTPEEPVHSMHPISWITG
jgi:hypothetical protein